jgi:hypothetical protein
LVHAILEIRASPNPSVRAGSQGRADHLATIRRRRKQAVYAGSPFNHSRHADAQDPSCDCGAGTLAAHRRVLPKSERVACFNSANAPKRRANGAPHLASAATAPPPDRAAVRYGQKVDLGSSSLISTTNSPAKI